MKSHHAPLWLPALMSLTTVCLLLSGCGNEEATTTNTQTPQVTPAGSQSAPPADQTPTPPPNAVNILFAYGSEKKSWVEALTPAFNEAGFTLPDGKVIHVTTKPMGSGELVNDIMAGTLEAHVISPASQAFITLGNARWKAKTNKPLVEDTKDLVLSPVIIAMWKPMAEALGWPEKELGWSDIITQAKNPEGWGAHGYPQWGDFKYGHTHPEYSNSGLISLLAECYAGAGKVSGLTLEDVASEKVGNFLQEIEQAVVHYGRSTGFFGKRMMAGGPGYLSAAVLYENMVIESYDPQHQLPFPIVAIYPKEGTFWSDHPAGIVRTGWVGADEAKAGEIYLEWLLAREQQERALGFGFRPADPDIPFASPLDKAHGVDPEQPRTTLEVPQADVLNAVMELWRERKKNAEVVLATYDVVFVYENLAIANLGRAEGRWGRLHVDYPAINMWNDNPYYIIDAPWSTPAHRQAAQEFLDFLLSKPIQEKALAYGFRPADPDISITGPNSPFNKLKDYGLKVDIPRVAEAPIADVIENLLLSWQRSVGR